ncbi:MAG: VWA domain-containing protein [Deltaproteobacteria bacterium]|nr:VWA domain-containing protein [Deltaproteobacteria bacterium]
MRPLEDSVRRRVRSLSLACAGLLLAAGVAGARERYATPDPPAHEPYQADALEPVRAGVPAGIELLRAADAPAWPERLRAEVADRVRSEWPAERVYGPIFANLGVTLRWPLVNAESDGSVIVPVVDELELPIEGALSLSRGDGPRRVVILVDASESANSMTEFRSDGRGAEAVSVLEAERRALDHLLDLSQDDWLEIGVIAFGETTWPVAEPGLPVEGLRAALADFRQQRPRGEGRTDAVCALWTAREWLDSTPKGVAREIVVLTDGDAAFSGRFLDCAGDGRARSDAAASACEARRNPAPCPASHRFSRSDGTSDLVQLASFARRARGVLAVHALLFEPDRSARSWQRVVADTGGRLVRVPGPEAIELALPSLVSSRIGRVVARNATLGVESSDLLAPDRTRLLGALALTPGANDVELRVESDRGTAALLRFRVYAAPRQLEVWLAALRERNSALELRAEELKGESGAKRGRESRDRSLAVDPEPDPAAAAKSP